MAFKVIKTSKASPATALAEPLILPLTFFDMMFMTRSPTEQVTFYSLPESSRESFYSVTLPKLEHSLSIALSHFLPLSGHLKWDPQDPKPHILVLPQDGVSLTVAETSADFSRLSGKGLRPQAEIRPLVPHLRVSPDSASLLSLQITLFPNQGFAIGTTVHHASMDGQTAEKFNKTWAHICKHGGATPKDLQLPMLLDRSVMHVPTGLERKLLDLMSYLEEDKESARTFKVPPSKNIDDVVRITIEVTQKKVNRLMERAKTETTRSDLRLSTFVVTFAHVVSCMVKMRGGKSDRPVRFRYVADCRNRLSSPVPVNYFGNCVVSIVIPECKAKTFLGEDGFVNAVEILSDSISSVGSRGLDSFWEKYEQDKKSLKPGTQVMSVTGSNRFGIYESDFGWGKPVNTEMMSIFQNGQISMSQRRDETSGVEIGISLTKTDMALFLALFHEGFDY